MKRSKRKNRADTPQQAPEPGTGGSAPAGASRRWALVAAVLGLFALVSGAIHFATRQSQQGFIPKGQAAGGPPPTLAWAAESNGPVRLPGSAATRSNWDAILAGQEKNRATAELTTRANALLDSGDSKSAVGLLEEALRLNPEDEDLHYNLGIAYGRSGDVTNAEHHYREALRLLPDYPEVHNNLGNLLLHAGRLVEAEAEFTEAIKLMPSLATAHNNLGIVRQRQNRLPEAIACFRKAVECNTNYWQAHLNLALASKSQGAKEESLRELRTVLRLNPGYAPAQRVLDELVVRPVGP